MHAIEAFLGRPEVERLGWVLLHFLWQGTIGAAFLAIALFILRRASANARYLAACAMLVAMAACLPATWLVVPQRSPPTRPAVAAMAAADPQPMVVAHEMIAARDGGTVIGAQNKPLDELFAKGRHQQPPEINAQAAVAAAPGMTWQQRIAAGLPWFAAVWLGGVLILSLRLAVGWSSVRRLRRAASQPADDSRQAVLARLSRQLGIRWPVKLLESALVEVPTMIGWLRPAILWPPSVLAGLSVEQFESLLAHELAHVRRHDYLVNLAQTAIETLLFYHPAVWWISNRIRQERECCCDDLAVATCGNRISYARALTALEELRPRPRQFALAADGGRLLLRIRRIVGLPAPRRTIGRHWLLGVILSFTFFALALALGLSNFATGDEPATNPKPQIAVDANDKSKPDERAQEHAPSNQLGFDLTVRKVFNSEPTDLLPEEFGEQLKRVPHVKSVWGSLTSSSPPAFGLPFDSPPIKRANIVTGRNLTIGDRRKIIVGKLLPPMTGWKVGGTIKIQGADFEVAGISDSPRKWEIYQMITLLADLQPLMHAEHKVTEFLVSVDIPQNGSREHESQMAELRARIAAAGNAIHSDLTIYEHAQQEKPEQWPKFGNHAEETELSGRVVDDVTGNPVPYFHMQGGSYIDPHTIQWGLTEVWSGPLEHAGDFLMPINWRKGWRGRIVAGGYVPERILTEPPDPTKARIEDIIVRMNRGRTISGRVLDYSGKPVAGASLFVIGALNSSTRLHIAEGKAFVEEGGNWTEDLSMPPFKTDADGKFTVTGIGWDAKFIAISGSALDLWIVPAPEEKDLQNFEIRLPQAGKLIVNYEIPGAPDEAEVALWPENNEIYAGTRGPEGPGTFIAIDSEQRPLDWAAKVFYNRIGKVKQRGEIVFDNLPAGEYVVQRVKEFETILGANGKVGVDRRVVKLAAGATTKVDWVRKSGAAVTGEITGLDNDQLRHITSSQVFVTVETTKDNRGPSQALDYVPVATIDTKGSTPEAKFTTEHLSPGKYRIVAKVFDDSSSRLATLNGDPLFVGDATVDVPENGSPPPITIEVHKSSKPTKPAPAKAAAPAPAKQGAEFPAKAQPNPALLTRVISGHAVDAETGQPVQGFVYDEATFYEHDPARFHWNGDAIGPGSQRDGEFGIVVKNQPGRPLWARIVAPGYVPQPITDKPIVLGDDTVLDKLVVKMHRGKELAGRVVDSGGKPVADAGVYLLRNQGRRQVVRDPAVAGPNQQFEMLAITHTATDADGRFKMTGWDAESGRVAVLSGEMNLWVTAIPADAADWTIHLPHPATIECLVDNDRGERDTFYDLDFVTAGRKGWEMLRAYLFNLRSKDGRLVMANHTPGQYQLTRRRHVAVGDYEGEFHLADVKLQVNPADTFTIDLRRPVGSPIAGQVAGLKDLGLSGAVISVEPRGEAKRGAMTFDALTCGEDGRFETGRIPPGKYRVHVDAYLPKKPADPRISSGGIDLPSSARMPDFTADVDVTIAKDEQPAKLKLELKKGGESRAFRELMQYHEQPHPAVIDEFTAPPWAAAAPNENPAEKPKTGERPTPMSHNAPYRNGFDLTAQIWGKDFRPFPEGWVDQIRHLPHVTAAVGGISDVVYFREYDLQFQPVIIGGVSPVAALVEGWRAKSGRLLNADDHHSAIFGKELAESFGVKVGETFKIYGSDLKIVGIFEGNNEGQDRCIAIPIKDLQEFKNQPNVITGIGVTIDFPRDGSAEHRAELNQLRERINAIGSAYEGFAAVEVPPDEPQKSEKTLEKSKTDKSAKKPDPDDRSLVVQRNGTNAQLNNGLAEELGDRIKAIPHVKAVSASLMDVVSFPEHQLVAVVISGLPPDSPLFAEWKLKTGRLPKAGDHAKAIVGIELAKNMKVNVTDKIRIYDSDLEIIGIFESENAFENGSIATLLTDLQKFMERPKQVTGFFVRTDVSREDPPENRALIADLRERIEALGEGIAASETPPEKPAEKAKPEAPKPESKPIDVRGQVIDDATGKPITLFDQQGGHVDPKDATKITWGYYLRPNAGGAEGRFDASIDWNAGWRARIIASGYLPQPILTEPPKAGQTKIEGLVLRMKRGREVSGRVLDHAGKPVKDASLFVVGSRPVEITGGKALMNSSHGLVEDSSAVRYSTDADGRFTLSGIGEDAKNIAVSYPAVDLWIVPAPSTDEAAKGFEIRLPEPGKLIVHYDIPGGAEEATIFLQLHTWDREGWKGVDNRRRPTVKQHGELALDNMPPGLYEVVRDSDGFLDRRQVTIEAGKTVTTDFIRKTGAPITGRVVGLDREDVQKAKPTRISVSVHKPGDERNPLAPKFASVGIDPFDKDGKPGDGSFKTEIIPPGEYRVRASVFIKERPERGYRTGTIPPGFEGEATVTVPEQGAPPPVEIQLKKWVYQPFEFKKTEPPPMPELPKPETSKQQAPNSETPKSETPKQSPRQDAYESAFKRGLNSLAEPLADKGVGDAVKQGLQAIGNKQNDDEASRASVTKALLYLARKEAQEAAGEKAPDEVVTKIDPTLAAGLLALDAMRGGTNTPIDKVDEAGRKLLEKYQKPEEQGQIYFKLLQMHGDSGLQTPNRIISYAQEALKYPLGSRHELRVYIYWGDTLNVQKTERPFPEQRKEAATVYLKGLKLAWMYPETPPAVPDPPPRYDGPEGPEQSARQKAWERYRDLRNKADFIKEVNYDRAIFIRHIADMYYHRPSAAAATPAEIDALRKQAAEILQNDAAVARLMAAINPDPDAVHVGNAALPAFDINSKTTPADAVRFGNTALPADAPKEEAPKEDPKQTPPKESTKQEAYDSAFKRGLNSLAEPPADKGFDDAVKQKQGLQAIGQKPGGDEATNEAIKKGLEYLARKQAEEATASQHVPNEVTIKIDPALSAELQALDAMRAGTSTPFDKVDEIGRKLLDRYPKPEEQGQIYYALLQVHGQSGVVTPEHITEYSKQALKYPLGSRQELMVYIYWGDTLNVRKAEKPWSEQRREAAEVYLKGLKRTWEYHAPEQPPELPDPPPLYDGPEGAEQAARQKAMEHYMALRSKADFIKELIYHRHIFIRQIADMYHRRPATQAEIEALRKQATEILASDAAVARLMAAVTADPTKAAERADDSLTKAAIEGLVVSQATEHSRDEHPWSKAVAGVAARFSFERVREVNGTPIIATYLELRNASDSATPIEIALDPSKIEFTVSDVQVKPVAQAGLPYDGATALPGTLRLPHDSQLRLGVSGNGAGIPKDQGALLDLASSAVWLFQRGDAGEYNLHAKFTIPKTDDHLWHGTIEVPAARIPLAK